MSPRPDMNHFKAKYDELKPKPLTTIGTSLENIESSKLGCPALNATINLINYDSIYLYMITQCKTGYQNARTTIYM